MLVRAGRLFNKVFLWRKNRRLQRLRRSPRVFVPTPSKFSIVIPFKTISLLLIIFLSLTSLYLLLRSDIFLVEQIDIVWQGKSRHPRYINEIELKDLLDRYRASSIVLLKPSEVEKETMRTFLPLSSVAVVKKWPDKLEIKLAEREPLAILESVRIEQVSKEERRERRERFLVDKEGWLFARPQDSDSKTLPIFELIGERQLQEGSFISGSLVDAALKILAGLKDMPDFVISKVSLGEAGLIYLTGSAGGPDPGSGAWSATFDSKSDLDQQIHSLQVITKEAKMKGKGLKSVDLRYLPPVVRW